MDLHSIETSYYNDNSISDTKETSTETPPTSSWKDWFAYIGNIKNPDIDNTSYVGNTIDDKVKNAAEYFGNNVFTLEVEKFSLVGVLKKLPTFGIAAQYDNNAVNDIVTSLNKTLNSPIVQKINSLLGVEQIPAIAGGNATSQVYTGCSKQSFDLSFRIYSLEPIGPMDNATGYKRAIAALCLYAPALHTLDTQSMLATLGVNLGRTANAIMTGVVATHNFVNQELVEHVFTESERPADTQDSTAVRNVVNSALTHGKNLSNYAISAVFNEDGQRASHINNFLNEAESTAESVQSFLQNKHYSLTDRGRVESSVNWSTGIFGGAIWNLSICPGLLKHKIPVYIKTWNITPSKEIDYAGNAAYVDFELHCEMDQLKTGSWWVNNIYDSETDTYKNLYKKQIKTPD